jgi:hypothetical protein
VVIDNMEDMKMKASSENFTTILRIRCGTLNMEKA